MKTSIPSLLLLLASCAGPEGLPGPAGIPGQAGPAGLSALVTTSDEAAGANCANGGVRVDFGVDDDADGTLDATEIDGTDYVCNGEDAAQALIETTIVYEADGSCPQGYEIISIGVDDGSGGGTAHDGLLQPGEIGVEMVDCLADDVDADGTFNVTDNCPDLANADQADADLDGLGDSCDSATTALTVYGITRGSEAVESSLYQLDLASNAATLIGPTGHALVALKQNPADGKLYGITRQADVGLCNNCLVEVDTVSGAATVVVPYAVSGSIPSIAFLSDGTLYGWTEAGDTFVAMSADGTVTSLGSSESSWGHGMCASTDDVIFWVNGSGATYRIGEADGERTWLGDIGASVTGWWKGDGFEGSTTEYGVRGDCQPDSLIYLGVDVTYGSQPASLVTVQLSPDGAPTFLHAVPAPLADLHGLAIMR